MSKLAYLARGTGLALLIVVVVWVKDYLGGVSTKAVPDGKGGTDTSKIFNWHPVLMTLAFGVFMAEALMAYDAPILPSCSREVRKKIHYSLHMCAVVLAALGVWAAFASHNLKLPTPIPNLYSPHSFLGMATVVLLALQFLVGLGAYLYPKASLSQRTALGPFHKFVGRAVWCMGLAAMATGIQEKTTFLQAGKGLSGDALFGAVIRLPGVALLLLALLACLVLFHQVRLPLSHKALKAQIETDYCRV